MIKGFKVRIFPTSEHEVMIKSHIGSCRKIWNLMLSYAEVYYQDCGKKLSRFDMMKLVTQFRHTEDYKFLSTVSSKSLQQVCIDLSTAFKDFSKKVHGRPKFKSKKRAKQVYPIRGDVLYFDAHQVQIEKLGKVNYQTNLSIPLGKGHKFMNPRVCKQGTKWILSFSMECENQAYELNDMAMGIDLGIKELAVASFGDSYKVFHSINKTRRVKNLENKLSHIQRVVSRKYKVGNKLHPETKWQKTNAILYYEGIIRKIYNKLHNIRMDYIHKTTHELVSTLPKVVGMETLNIMGMMKNRRLAKNVQKQCFYEFYRQMQYKCEARGIKLIQVDMFYPSSKTCSHCGHIKRDLKLSDRTYVCPECGMILDRDLNASINLANKARALLE